jgi:hypothetical protein
MHMFLWVISALGTWPSDLWPVLPKVWRTDEIRCLHLFAKKKKKKPNIRKTGSKSCLSSNTTLSEQNTFKFATKNCHKKFKYNSIG